MTARRWTTVGIATAMTLTGVLVAPVAASAAPTDGTLTVMLTDPEKQPLAMDGVTVELLDAAGRIEDTAMSDPRGRLTFDDVPAGPSRCTANGRASTASTTSCPPSAPVSSCPPGRTTPSSS